MGTKAWGARFVRGSALAVLLLRSAAADPAPEGTALLDPERPGPFAVGVTTCTFYDAARADPHTGKTPRALKTEIWYPASDESRALPKNRFSDFLDRGKNPKLNALAGLVLGAPLATIDGRFQNTAIRDAVCREGSFPLLLFSHGNGAVRTQSVFWCEHMASHGYVVAAPDHTGNATATTVGGTLVFGDKSPGGIDASRKARPADLRFLIDVFDRLDRGDDSRFAGHLDMERVGLAGHSFGAWSAIAAADVDPRVRAVSPWASCGQPLTRSDLPVLLLLADEDVALTLRGIEACRAWFASVPGPRFLVDLRDAGHNSFTEMFQLDPKRGDGVGTGKRVTNGAPITYPAEDVVHRQIDGCTLAFFDRYLKGVVARDDYLRTSREEKGLVVTARPAAAAR